MKMLCRNKIGGQKWVGRPYFISIKSGLIEISLSKRNYGIAKISLCRIKIHCSPMLDTAASVPLATVPYILQLAIFFFLFSSCFEILHSRLAEIDIRPYEIDGNQPDFGYD